MLSTAFFKVWDRAIEDYSFTDEMLGCASGRLVTDMDFDEPAEDVHDDLVAALSVWSDMKAAQNKLVDCLVEHKAYQAFRSARDMERAGGPKRPSYDELQTKAEYEIEEAFYGGDGGDVSHDTQVKVARSVFNASAAKAGVAGLEVQRSDVVSQFATVFLGVRESFTNAVDRYEPLLTENQRDSSGYSSGDAVLSNLVDDVDALRGLPEADNAAMRAAAQEVIARKYADVYMATIVANDYYNEQYGVLARKLWQDMPTSHPFEHLISKEQRNAIEEACEDAYRAEGANLLNDITSRYAYLLARDNTAVIRLVEDVNESALSDVPQFDDVSTRLQRAGEKAQRDQESLEYEERMSERREDEAEASQRRYVLRRGAKTLAEQEMHARAVFERVCAGVAAGVFGNHSVLDNNMLAELEAEVEHGHVSSREVVERAREIEDVTERIDEQERSEEGIDLGDNGYAAQAQPEAEFE